MLPATAPELLVELGRQNEELRVRLGQGALASMWVPAMTGKEIALALIKKAARGSIPHIKEFFERMDGKVPQMLLGDKDHPAVTIVVTGVPRPGDDALDLNPVNAGANRQTARTQTNYGGSRPALTQPEDVVVRLSELGNDPGKDG